MKILLLGANGQVGFELHRSLAALGPIVAATRTGTLPGGAPCETARLEHGDAVRALVARVAPDVVVNAAAYTAVDRAEDEPALAHAVNALAPGAIGEAARAAGAAVLHFSTDYVFAGDADVPYREDDPTGPTGVYGLTKLEGERRLAASGADALVFRTAWVHAARGHNFVRTMLKLAATRERLTVVADQRGAPTPARLLGAVAAHALGEAMRGSASARWGTYHVAASGITSWCDFAREVVARGVAAGLVARAPEVAAIATSEYPTRARRPAYSALDTGKLERTFGLAMPGWREGVAACVAEIAEGRA